MSCVYVRVNSIKMISEVLDDCKATADPKNSEVATDMETISQHSRNQILKKIIQNTHVKTKSNGNKMEILPVILGQLLPRRGDIFAPCNCGREVDVLISPVTATRFVE
jgi:hypothetical protein